MLNCPTMHAKNVGAPFSFCRYELEKCIAVLHKVLHSTHKPPPSPKEGHCLLKNDIKLNYAAKETYWSVELRLAAIVGMRQNELVNIDNYLERSIFLTFLIYIKLNASSKCK